MTVEISTTCAGAAFDAIASEYDDLFTTSRIGRVQRALVWEEIGRVFHPGETILELNCGTGEDALHLAQRGIRVVGCDSSVAMVNAARRKLQGSGLDGYLTFHVLPTERLSELDPELPIDGVFSNFAGLNCVADWRQVGEALAPRLRAEGSMVLCVYSKLCAWEALFYALKGDWKKALRRLRRKQAARLGESEFTVYYPSIPDIQAAFAPWFALKQIRGVGVVIPPSYLEAWVARHPMLFRALEKVEARTNRLPLLRTIGDHVMLTFTRSLV